MALKYVLLGILTILQENVYVSAASVRYQTKSIKIVNETTLRDIRPIYMDEYQKCEDNICETGDFYYPQNIIENLLRSPRSIFETLMNSSRDSFEIVLESKTAVTEENICRSSDRPRYPKIMRNTANHWKYIVNTDKYSSWFVTHTCQENDSSYCNTVFKSQCQQQYTKVNLMVYENYTLDYDIFWIQSGCKCSCK
ncbi:uncharacterized protein LOC143196546 [Rhynchophorus ferrugineus]|uniref:Spaetzle domain-containing protein n=1 Tax=Rhynchophorus ferrugineus TaxID=354439 RepID=A0A834I302_RHYFE|nr:hypothetical protein GWI33_015610 [Rhynchophorus ferrugineus]